MRIIRFNAADGRELYGEDRGDGTATVLADVDRVLTPAARGPHRARELAGKRALVADDDANMRTIMSTVLDKAGCSCTVCSDGAEAMAAIEHESLDLMVCDIVMPHHDGYELFTAARSRYENIPVLLVTGFGYDPSHTLVRAAKAGHKSVLYKPFTPEKLLNEITKAVRSCNGRLSDTVVRTSETVEVARLLAPVGSTNVLCVGTNYRRADGSGEPPGLEELEVFMKPTTAVQAPGRPIRLPDFGGVDAAVECEGELAVVIGAPATDVSPDEAASCILGYTIANDVTARAFQTTGGAPRWMRGKGFDTFCPLGPAIVTSDELDPGDLTITTRINDRVIQQGTTGAMLHPAETIVSMLSRHLTLQPGTVVLTGTPPAATRATLEPGDEVSVEIDHLGRLSNPVVS